MGSEPGKPTDRRGARRREQRRLLLIVILFLVVVGSIVIALVYGAPAAGLGLVCLLGGAGVLGLLWLMLVIVERFSE